MFTKLFRFRIRLKFQNELFLDYFPISVQNNLIFVYIDMVNVVLDLKWIRLKYMLETIKYNKVGPVIWWAHIFITVATIKFTFSFIKKLTIPRSLVWSTKLSRIRLKLKILLLWTFFKTYYNYLTIDWWYLINFVLQTRLLGILSFFMKEKVNFIVATVMKMWAH